MGRLNKLDQTMIIMINLVNQQLLYSNFFMTVYS